MVNPDRAQRAGHLYRVKLGCDLAESGAVVKLRLRFGRFGRRIGRRKCNAPFISKQKRAAKRTASPKHSTQCDSAARSIDAPAHKPIDRLNFQAHHPPNRSTSSAGIDRRASQPRRTRDVAPRDRCRLSYASASALDTAPAASASSTFHATMAAPSSAATASAASDDSGDAAFISSTVCFKVRRVSFVDWSRSPQPF